MVKSDDLARIIIGCKDGSGKSFSQLVDIYSNRLYGYFYRLTGDGQISDDLLSEVFLRLVEKIGSYKTGPFESWLFRVASNIFYDYLRDKQRQSKLLDVIKNEIESRTTKPQQSDNETYDRLQNRLKKLDSDVRELIMLRFYSQLSFKEIAQIRAEPIGTVLSKVHRGLKKLRKMME